MQGANGWPFEPCLLLAPPSQTPTMSQGTEKKRARYDPIEGGQRHAKNACTLAVASWLARGQLYRICRTRATAKASSIADVSSRQSAYLHITTYNVQAEASNVRGCLSCLSALTSVFMMSTTIGGWIGS
mmetsp:Transcript_66580/g.144584  ORF Transcript_66580/g.144584 Transcript_66580/m.144584 type:complete len:129 (+) Transcript_66580:213-599(+)